MAIRKTDLEAIPKIWGPDHRLRPKDYRVFEHAVQYQHLCKQQWEAVDVGASAVSAVAFDPTGQLCALGCDHSLVVVLDATMDGLPVVLKLFDPAVYGHKASRGSTNSSLDRFVQRCLDLRWTETARVVALYDCRTRADRACQSYFFVYDLGTASILRSVSFGDRVTSFELFDGSDAVIAALDDGNLCHFDLKGATLAPVTVDDQALTISEQRSPAHQTLSTLEKVIKRSLQHYSRLHRAGDDLLVYLMDKKRLRRVTAERTVAAAAQLDTHDKSYSLKTMSVNEDRSRVVCVPERGWVQVLDVASLSVVASFGIDSHLYPGPICWAAGSFVHARSKRGQAKSRLMLFVDHQSDYGLRDRAYLWKGVRDGKLEDERWTSAPRNVRSLAASRSLPVIVVSDNKGGCYSLVQRMTTSFAGPMCPPGYEVIEECIRYYEVEDELDLEVYDKNNCEINVDELIYPKLRKSLVPSDDIWTARRRILMRGWASDEPAEVDITSIEEHAERTRAFEPGRHCRLLRENYQAARELEIMEDGEAEESADVLEAKNAALGPFISLPQGIMSGSFAARMSKEAKAAEGLLTALQPERLEPKLQMMRAEAEKKFQRMLRAKEKKAQKREQEKQQREEELAKERAEREAAIEAAQRAVDAKDANAESLLQNEPSASSSEAMNGPDDAVERPVADENNGREVGEEEEDKEEAKEKEKEEEKEAAVAVKPAEAAVEMNGNASAEELPASAAAEEEVPMEVAAALQSDQAIDPHEQPPARPQEQAPRPADTQVASSPAKESTPSSLTSRSTETAAAGGGGGGGAGAQAGPERQLVKQEDGEVVVHNKKQPTRSPPAHDPAPKRPKPDSSTAPGQQSHQRHHHHPPSTSAPTANGHERRRQEIPPAQDPYFALLSGFGSSSLPPSYMAAAMQDPYFLAQLNATSSLWGTPAFSLLPGAPATPPVGPTAGANSADPLSHFHPPRPATSFHADQHRHHHRTQQPHQHAQQHPHLQRPSADRPTPPRSDSKWSS